MTNSVNLPPAASSSFTDAIATAVDRLRHLTQMDVQTAWHAQKGEFSSVTAIPAQQWQTWAIAPLNDRQHIAWSKGQQELWLCQRVTVPECLQDYPLSGLSLRLALTWWAERAEIFVNGVQVQVGDLFDCSARILLSAAVQPGDQFDVALRLISPGHDDGALVRSRCLYEVADGSLTPCPEPGFVADELEVLQLYLTYFEPQKLEVLAAAVHALDWAALPDRQRFERSLLHLRHTLLPLSDRLKQRQIFPVGHAHLDLAWLWPISETWEAAERTFTSVLQLQQEYPELIFGHSTPALYHWLEENRPDLFAAIQQQVTAGRWEVAAGLWVEPELNTVSGESIVRQVLYGQRYVQAKFGAVSAIAWLPDSFGFCWQLPQILAQGEVQYFVTQKLRWNDTTEFPYDWFEWRSPDGSTILSLTAPPIGEGIDPVKMARYACQWELKTGFSAALWLPGVGDHGGGPSRDMLNVLRRWQQSPFFPRLQFTTAQNFLDSLAAQSQSSAQRQTGYSGSQTPDFQGSPPIGSTPVQPIPVWNDELYLEFHRGCYTSHADQKQWNRNCERLLYQAELFASIATLIGNRSYPKQELESAWKQVLFNQFHDILPGSCIPEVYAESDQNWIAAEQTGQQILADALRAIAAQIDLSHPPHPEAQPIVVFNPLNWERSAVVEVPLPSSPEPLPDSRLPNSRWQVFDSEGRLLPSQSSSPAASEALGCSTLCFSAQVPGLGYSVYWLRLDSILDEPSVLSQNLNTLENEFLKVEVDPATGNVKSVWDKVHHCQVLSAPGNELQAFQDEGQYWDAWNIDPHYAQHPLPNAKLLSMQRLESGAVRSRLQVVRQIGQSCFAQIYRLEAESAVLNIDTYVDWRERHVMVKAAFPLNLSAHTATYDMPYGAIERPLGSEDAKDGAKWEVPALHWADLSAPNYGVSLLNDAKYGYDCTPAQLRLTLLRSPTWPDPESDQGQHHFSYALYPHRGSWQVAQTVRRGYELNYPLQVVQVNAAATPSSAKLPLTSQFFDLRPENLILTAFKQSEDDPKQWVVRGYECQGKQAAIALAKLIGPALAPYLQTDRLTPVNLLEHPVAEQGAIAISEAAPETGAESFHVAPWKIISFTCQSREPGKR